MGDECAKIGLYFGQKFIVCPSGEYDNQVNYRSYSLFSPPNHPFHVNYPNPTFVLQFVAIVSLSVFTIFLAAQSFFNFEFLNNPKCYTRLKKSAFTSTFLLGFMILNEVTFTFLSSKSALAAYALSSLLMFGLFIIKN